MGTKLNYFGQARVFAEKILAGANDRVSVSLVVFPKKNGRAQITVVSRAPKFHTS